MKGSESCPFELIKARRLNMLLLISIIVAILFIVLVVIIWKKNTHKKKFNDNPRTSGEKVEEQYEDDDEEDETEENDDSNKVKKTIDLGIVRAGDEIFDSWEPMQELFKEAGIVDVIDDMIEFDEGDGLKTFVGIAEMEQSNPYLKTQHEKQIDDALQQLFLSIQGHRFKISLQWAPTDMKRYFAKARERIEKSNESPELKKIGNSIIQAADNYEHDDNRFKNTVYVQFIETVDSPDIAEAETKDQVNQKIYEVANRRLENDIAQSNEILRERRHALRRLSSYEILELIYITFNRRISRMVSFDQFVRQQKFTLYTTASESDEAVQQYDEVAQIERQTKTAVENDKEMQALKADIDRKQSRYNQLRTEKREKIKEDLQGRRQAKLREEIKKQNEQQEEE